MRGRSNNPNPPIRTALALARSLETRRLVPRPKGGFAAHSTPRFDWADTLAFQLRAMHLPEPTREYRFDAQGSRRWRFDCAWVPALVACEINGAEWTQGRHSRGAGMAKDFEKLNTATLQGWTIFQFTGSQVKNGYALDVLTEVFQALAPARATNAVARTVERPQDDTSR